MAEAQNWPPGTLTSVMVCGLNDVGNCHTRCYVPVMLPAPLGLLPVVGVGVNQVGRLNLGRCVASLRYFAVYGQQEGYQPFGADMARDPAVWMSWQQPQFSTVLPDHPRLQVTARPQNSASLSLFHLFLIVFLFHF